jgi:hypothetical protein
LVVQRKGSSFESRRKIEAVLSENPPRHLLLGSDAYGLVTRALQARLSAFERQKAVAFSTDVDQGEDAS